MTKLRALLGAVLTVAFLLGWGPAVHAQQNYTLDNGSMHTASEDACLVFISGVFLGGLDCTYNASDPVMFGFAGWSGPIFSAAFYPVGQSPFDTGSNPVCDGIGEPAIPCPGPGDTKADVPITGTLTIDDQGTACDLDDTITGQIELGAATRAATGGGDGRLEETWGDGDVVWAIAEKTVDSATVNGQGGCDYEIASKGFPELLQEGGNGTPYPTESDSVGADFWGNTPAAVPMGSWNPSGAPSGNVGTTITATTSGIYACSEIGTDGTACDANPTPDGGATFIGSRQTLENVLIAVSTDAAGDITSGQIFPNNESRVLNTVAPLEFPKNNAWDGGLVTFTATCTDCGGGGGMPMAVDDTATVPQDSMNSPIDVLANDQNIAAMPAPVINIVTNGTNGTGAVMGGVIEYTPNASFAGSDSLVYNVDTEFNSAPFTTNDATVSITVEALVLPDAPGNDPADPAGGASIADAIRGEDGSDIDIAVDVVTDLGAELGNNGGTVTNTAPSGGGTVAQSGANGEILTYTPPDSNPIMDSFDYTITDNDSNMSTGTINVEVPDVSPSVTTPTTDGAVAEDETSTDIDVTGSVELGNGTIDEHVFAVSTDPTDGDAEFGSPIVTYTPNQSFVQAGGGEDCFEYTVTDVDGSVSGTGEVCVQVAGVQVASGLPGGSSAIDLWSLSMLLGLPLLRQRHRR